MALGLHVVVWPPGRRPSGCWLLGTGLVRRARTAQGPGDVSVTETREPARASGRGPALCPRGGPQRPSCDPLGPPEGEGSPSAGATDRAPRRLGASKRPTPFTSGGEHSQTPCGVGGTGNGVTGESKRGGGGGARAPRKGRGDGEPAAGCCEGGRAGDRERVPPGVGAEGAQGSAGQGGSA